MWPAILTKALESFRSRIVEDRNKTGEPTPHMVVLGWRDKMLRPYIGS